MGSLAQLCFIAVALVLICLISFSLFAIGFLIGYKIEDKRLLKKKQNIENNELSKEQKRQQKEWKNFLEYDGSVPYKNE